MPQSPTSKPHAPSPEPHAPCPMLSVLFRCDGSPEIGLGHVIRCLALADELHEVHNCRITFAMRTGQLGIKMVEEKSYQVLTSQEGEQAFDYGRWLNECVRNVEAKVIILDVRDGLARTVVDELRNKGILIVTIDDPEDKRLSADLAFFPPVPQVKRIDWTGFTGELHAGWEWVILRKEFSRIPRPVLPAPCSVPQAPNSILRAPSSVLQAPCSKIPRILVTMGGSDPQGMTIKAVKALEMLDEDFEVVVVLGAGFQHKKQLDDLLSDCKHYFDVQEDVKNMAEIMAQSDLAVASFGVTAYELAAMGVPAIYLCLTEDHAESASAFVEAGMGVSLGVFACIKEEHLSAKVKNILLDKSLPYKFADNAIRHIDGQGTMRITKKIIQSLLS